MKPSAIWVALKYPRLGNASVDLTTEHVTTNGAACEISKCESRFDRYTHIDVFTIVRFDIPAHMHEPLSIDAPDKCSVTIRHA